MYNGCWQVHDDRAAPVAAPVAGRHLGLGVGHLGGVGGGGGAHPPLLHHRQLRWRHDASQVHFQLYKQSYTLFLKTTYIYSLSISHHI